MVGNNVSHAQNKTRRRWSPNLCVVTLSSDALGQSYKLRVSAKGLRSVDHAGGLDAFLLKAKERDLGPKASAIRKELVKKHAGAQAA